MKKRKQSLLHEFDILDVFSKKNCDVLGMREIKDDLNGIWKKEEGRGGFILESVVITHETIHEVFN